MRQKESRERKTLNAFHWLAADSGNFCARRPLYRRVEPARGGPGLGGRPRSLAASAARLLSGRPPGRRMIVITGRFRASAGSEAQLESAFAESQKSLGASEGLVGRRLLRARDGSYMVIVEHQSRQTLADMRKSPEHARWHAKLTSLMDGPPQHSEFEPVVS